MSPNHVDLYDLVTSTPPNTINVWGPAAFISQTPVSPGPGREKKPADPVDVVTCRLRIMLVAIFNMRAPVLNPDPLRDPNVLFPSANQPEKVWGEASHHF